jgi:hypothetical protein
MKRNVIVSVLSGFLGSAMLLILLSAAGIVGARGADVARSDVSRANEVSAATPLTSTFTYQGQLKQSGSPVTNPTCQMAFRLYDDPSAGNLIGSPITTTMPVTNGLFTVGLNFGSNGSLFDGSGRWLDIQVINCGSGFAQLTPRQALTPAPYALALPGLYTQQNATSPNLIGGFNGNSVTSNVNGATIGGGGENLFPNRVTDDYGTVGGGEKNQAGNNNFSPSDSMYATISGGFGNTASGAVATVGGGERNAASGFDSTVGGGEGNIASGIGAFVGGGGYDGSSFSLNWAAGNGSTIGGGLGNSVGGNYATVPGGISNSAAMSYTLAAGRRAKANHTGTFVWADSTNADFTSTGNDQFLVRANGGVGINTNSPSANTLTVGGNGLKVGTTGSTLAVVQSGTATLGAGNSGVNVYTVTFPSVFSSPPKVIVTLRGQDYNDVFAVTTRNIATTQFQVNVYRIDLNGNSWLQTLQLDWLAWQ